MIPVSTRRKTSLPLRVTRAIPFTNPILNRRTQLGLSELKIADKKEIQILFKDAGVDLSTSEEGMSK